MKTKITAIRKLALIYSAWLILVLCSSCNVGNFQHQSDCRESVKKEFPNAIEIKKPIDTKWVWIVLDKDSSIWFVRTGNNFNTKVSTKDLMFKF